jgi:hypothetical protein
VCSIQDYLWIFEANPRFDFYCFQLLKVEYTKTDALLGLLQIETILILDLDGGGP